MKKKTHSSIYSETGFKFPSESHFHRKREKLGVEQVEFNGKPLSKSNYVVDDPDNRYQGMISSDFALENLLAVGADIKPVKSSLSLSEIDDLIPNT